MHGVSGQEQTGAIGRRGGGVPDRPPHRWLTRIWHWMNLVSLVLLFMSGLMIFNAHPRLYWGEAGNTYDYAWFAVGSSPTQSYVRIGETRIPSTGFIGNWRDDLGQVQTWAFPGWMTIPSTYDLAAGRRWHFFAAWIFAFGLLAHMLGSLINRHLARDLVIRRSGWRPRALIADIAAHLRLRFDAPPGKLYNPLQKLSYISVIFVALPLMIATGLVMSPGMDAALPWLTPLFGGRQSARSIHFITAFALVSFTLVHVALVLVHRPVVLMRDMTIGPPPPAGTQGKRA